MRFFSKHKKKPSLVVSRRRVGAKQVRAKRKARRKPVSKRAAFLVLLAVAILAYLIAFGWYVFFSGAFAVSRISVESGSMEMREEIRAFAEGRLSGRIWWMFPKANTFFVREEEVESAIRDAFPSLRFVEVEKIFPDTLIISTEEREAVLVWCPLLLEARGEKPEAGEEERSGEKQEIDNDELMTENKENKSEEKFEVDEFERVNAAVSGDMRCFVIDDAGYAYRDTNLGSEFEGGRELILVIAMNGFAPPLGGEVLEEETVRLLSSIPRTFSEQLYIDVANIFRMPAQFSGEVTVRAEEGWDIRLGTDIPLGESAAMLKTFFLRAEEAENRESLRWVDVRVPERIFYAVEEEGEQVTVNSGQ